MLKNLNKCLDRSSKQSPNVQRSVDNANDIDIDIGEKIIDKLFIFIKQNIDKDSKIDGVAKGMALFLLPGIRKGSIEYVRRNQSDIRVLLDDIQKELDRRR